jgi:argininosuccinate lyase
MGDLVSLLTLMKSQPLAYNKDNQEDKEPLFDAVDTVSDTLRIFAEMIVSITVKPEVMRTAALRGYAMATDLADYLVKKGLPFRDAHEAVAGIVRICIQSNQTLNDLSIDAIRQASGLGEQAALIGADISDVLTLEGCLAARDHLGGTAPNQVRLAIDRARNTYCCGTQKII